MRVYELAKEVGLDANEVIERLNALGVEATSNFNAVSDEDAERLRESLAEAGEGKTAKAAETAEPAKKLEAEDEPAAAKETKVAEAEEEEEAEVAEEEEEAEVAEEQEPPKAAAAETDSIATAHAGPDAVAEPIAVEDGVTVKDLAGRLGTKPADVIRELMSRGVMANINEALDAQVAVSVAETLGFEARVQTPEEELLGPVETGDPDDLEPRPPVVTVMGHVDHGKTLLLDAIRETNVVAREHGGITQHIGAWTVNQGGQRIVFIDTPGHEAFTRMRARGAQVTDLVVLVVAADDGVMPQTVEAIDHAKAAGVSIIVAINKTDLPTAQPDRVKQQLADRGLVPEDWGGDTVTVEVSAKEKTNLDELLEMIALSAELLELEASPKVPARGWVLEAELDRRRGPVATLLVTDGVLRVGASLIAGVQSAKVRALVDSWGEQQDEAGPATPVEVLGFDGVPQAGDSFQVVEESGLAREVSDIRQERERREGLASGTRMTLEDLQQQIREGEVKELPVVIKADTQGSLEVVRDTLEGLSGDQVRVEVIHAAVGGVSENDVMLATASDAIIVGFNVRPERGVDSAADREGVDLRLYNVIYQLVDDVKKAMEGQLEPTYEESRLGVAEVRDTFRVPRAGTVAGCYVTEGKMTRDARVRLVRDSRVVYEGRVGSLKRFKDDVREVAHGYECGLGIANFNDVKVGDVIEAYEIEEIRPSL